MPWPMFVRISVATTETKATAITCPVVLSVGRTAPFLCTAPRRCRAGPGGHRGRAGSLAAITFQSVWGGTNGPRSPFVWLSGLSERAGPGRRMSRNYARCLAGAECDLWFAALTGRANRNG